MKNALHHVAIIMDGNKRWAKKHNVAAIEGHKQGVKALEAVVDAALDYGITHLTAFGFSAENWQRPAHEVEALLALLEDYLNARMDDFLERQIALRIIGDRARFPDAIQARLALCEEKSMEVKTKMTLTMALGYGARQDITHAVRRVAEQIKTEKLDARQIDEALIAHHLQTHFLPPLDLLIRTSGELRLSNFMLWESAYSELYFSDLLWPDFDYDAVMAAFTAFENRERRYGL